MIRILIVDDQELMRESLELILKTDDRFEVTGLAENGQQAIRMVEDSPPDIVLMDIRMPEIDGTESLKIIKERFPKVKVIMLTTFDSDEYIYRSLKYGANGFLLKGISKDDLLSSITAVHSGGVSIDPKTAQKVFEIFGRMAQSYVFTDENQTVDNLSLIELRIIQYIGRGLSNKEIINEIHLSEGTVRNYISTILKKLDLRDRTQIAIFAIQYGLMLKDFS